MELLQIATAQFITKRDGLYKLRQLLYYKLRLSLLQIATGIAKCDGCITKCDDYTNCDSTLGGNRRGSYSWGYKEYNAITMHTSLSQ